VAVSTWGEHQVLDLYLYLTGPNFFYTLDFHSPAVGDRETKFGRISKYARVKNLNVDQHTPHTRDLRAQIFFNTYYFRSQAVPTRASKFGRVTRQRQWSMPSSQAMNSHGSVSPTHNERSGAGLRCRYQDYALYNTESPSNVVDECLRERNQQTDVHTSPVRVRRRLYTH